MEEGARVELARAYASPVLKTGAVAVSRLVLPLAESEGVEPSHAVTRGHGLANRHLAARSTLRNLIKNKKGGLAGRLLNIPVPKPALRRVTSTGGRRIADESAEHVHDCPSITHLSIE